MLGGCFHELYKPNGTVQPTSKKLAIANLAADKMKNHFMITINHFVLLSLLLLVCPTSGADVASSKIADTGSFEIRVKGSESLQVRPRIPLDEFDPANLKIEIIFHSFLTPTSVPLENSIFLNEEMRLRFIKQLNTILEWDIIAKNTNVDVRKALNQRDGKGNNDLYSITFDFSNGTKKSCMILENANELKSSNDRPGVRVLDIESIQHLTSVLEKLPSYVKGRVENKKAIDTQFKE